MSKKSALDVPTSPALGDAINALLNATCPPDPTLVLAFQSAYSLATPTTPLPATGVYDAATAAALQTIVGSTVPICPVVASSSPTSNTTTLSSNTALIVGAFVAVGAIGVLGYLLTTKSTLRVPAVAMANPRRRSRRRS